jgi:hypothetical protein
MALPEYRVVLKDRGFRRHLKGARKNFMGTLERNVRLAAEIVTGAAKEQFVGERTRALNMISGGRVITRKPPRPISSPADKLGVFTGHYRRAIGNSIRVIGKRVHAEVGPLAAVPYARVHEFGGKAGRNVVMPKRPVISPAVEATKERVFRLIGKTFRVL